ncbi:MAG TPA: OB-fold domain-containing protein [Acidimicrobiales bacterium]|jgi:hypothetical protein|nr:OB-fold domain-containing protein [Acidimicrobiales bacterium]
MTMHALPAGLPRPVPGPDGLDAPYWAGTRAHELRIQRCARCGAFRWGPEWICYVCHAREVDWPAVDARGVLFAYERVWHPVHPALAAAVPYIVALVELPAAGNVRVVGNLVGDPHADIPIGAAVEAVFEDHDDVDPPYTLVQWRLVASAG